MKDRVPYALLGPETVTNNPAKARLWGASNAIQAGQRRRRKNNTCGIALLLAGLGIAYGFGRVHQAAITEFRSQLAPVSSTPVQGEEGI